MGRGSTWNGTDDMLLCTAFMHETQDEAEGTQQKRDVFWEKVRISMANHGGDPARSTKSLKMRFGIISAAVAKFSSFMTQVDENPVSGQNSEDAEQAAREAYRACHPKGANFEFKDCWRFLTNAPRWARCDLPPEEGLSTEIDPTSPIDLSSPENVDSGNVRTARMTRPRGTKRANVNLADAKMQAAQMREFKRANDMAQERLKVDRMKVGITLFSKAEDSPESQEFFSILKAELLRDIRSRQPFPNVDESALNNNDGEQVLEFEDSIPTSPPFDLNI